jgi:hypothetical protein
MLRWIMEQLAISLAISNVAKYQHRERNEKQKDRRYAFTLGPVIDFDIGWRFEIGHSYFTFFSKRLYKQLLKVLLFRIA